MKKILVTGGTGMLGIHLKQILPDAIYVGSKDCDLTDLKQVRNLVSTYKPDIIVHLAARVGGIQDNISKPAEYFDDNILMNTNMVKVSHENNVNRFIGILSTCAYPNSVETYPMYEQDLFLGPPAPTNFSYGYAKRCLATQIHAYNKQFGLNYNYLIACNLYSEYDNFNNKNKMHFITAVLDKIKNSKDNKIKLLGNGKPLRQFIYAGDLADVIKQVIDKNITTNFNVAPDDNLSIDEMAKIALQVTNKDYEIEYSNPELKGQFRKDVSNDLMKQLLPNFKFTKFKNGIKKVYDTIS